MNNHDSDRMAQQLMASGMHPVDEPRQAGLIIINTCSVRAKPEHKALSEAGRFRRACESRGARIILAGCVARQEGRRLLHRAPYLDAVIGPDAVGRLVQIVDQIVSGRGPVLAVGDHDEQNPLFVPLGADATPSMTRFVTIMKGCDNYCSYCIVPYVRGREVSRPMLDILAEVKELGSRGVREVTLLGQNVNSYRDQTGADFPRLLQELDAQAIVSRIRFTTSHPKDLAHELIAAMAGLGSVVEHLHLAMQSGSDRILEKMRRGYTRDMFVEKALEFRAAVPGLSLTTDLIVGFPSETESDFQNTLEAVERVAFDGAFSFKYSPRPGTLAAAYEDDVPPEVKQDRLERLQTRLAELEYASLSSLVGREMEVLVGGSSVRDEAAHSGRTRCNRVVNFTSAQPIAPGDLITVKIHQARGHTMWGEGSQPVTVVGGSVQPGGQEDI